jgi:hypothetical protein
MAPALQGSGHAHPRVEEHMKQLQRVVVLVFALLLVAVPAVTLAQTPSSPGSSGSGTKSTTPGTSTSPSTTPGTGSSTSTGSGTAGQASPGMPASAEECKNMGWQKLGLKSEAECMTKVKK